MNAIFSKVILTSAGFLLILLSGFWLSRTGKPYSQIVFTFHKLVMLGTIVYLAVMIYQAGRSAPLPGSLLAAGLLLAVCFLAMLVTGGLLSVEKVFPPVIHRLHQVMPYLTAVSAGLSLYLLFFGRAVP